MSGLKIVAAIAGIVSAFNGSLTLYRSWRDKRRNKRRLGLGYIQRNKDKEMDLERSLSLGGSTIQEEYNLHFARLGPKFAVGDAQARAELSQYVIRLQHIIITLVTGGAVVLPLIPGLLEDSEGARTGTLRSLGEQYQRMMQARGLVNAGPSFAQRLLGYADAGYTRAATSDRGRAPEGKRATEKRTSRSPGHSAVRPRHNEVKKECSVGFSSRQLNDVDHVPILRTTIEKEKQTMPPPTRIWKFCGGGMLIDETSNGQEISCSHCTLSDKFEDWTSLPIVDLKDKKRVAIPVASLWKCHGSSHSQASYACRVCDPEGHLCAKFDELETLVEHIGHVHTLLELGHLIKEGFMIRCTCTGKWSGVWTMEDEHSYRCPTRSLYWGDESSDDS